MKRSSSLALTLALALGACTHHYKPNTYELARDRVAPVVASSPVAIVNTQTRTEDTLLWTMGVHKFRGNYREITEHFAGQLAATLAAQGVKVAASAPKRLEVSVIAVTETMASFHSRGQVTFSVTTGDGERVELVANNSSPANAWRVMNGTLALAVVEALQNERVRTYLAAPVAATQP